MVVTTESQEIVLLELGDDEVDVVGAVFGKLNERRTLCRADAVSAVVKEEGGFVGSHGDASGERDKEVFLDLTFPPFVLNGSTLTRLTSAIFFVNHDDFINIGDDEDLFGRFQFAKESVDLSVVPVENLITGLFEVLLGVVGGEFAVFVERIEHYDFDLWVVIGFCDCVIDFEDGVWLGVLGELLHPKERKALQLAVNECSDVLGKVLEGVRFS